MAEYTASAVQTVNPGESVVFTDTPSRCRRGFVRHRDDTGSFLLSGWVPQQTCCCPCMQPRNATYLVDFGADIAVPDGGTAGAISLAIAIDGVTIPSSIMTVTPADTEEYFNVSRAINADIWRNCCETVSVRNVSDQPILVSNANIIFSRPDLAVTR